jgi:hypothetical protein
MATAREPVRNTRADFPLELGPTGRGSIQAFTLHLYYSNIRAKLENIQEKIE